jgi:hypothetical protein
MRLHKPDIWITKDCHVPVAAGWKIVLEVTKTLSAPFHCVIITISFRVYHATKQRICGILTRTRRHEDCVNLLSIPNVRVYMASTLSH